MILCALLLWCNIQFQEWMIFLLLRNAKNIILDWQMNWGVSPNNIYQKTVFKVKLLMFKSFNMITWIVIWYLWRLKLMSCRCKRKRNEYVYGSVQLDPLPCSDIIVCTSYLMKCWTPGIEKILALINATKSVLILMIQLCYNLK